MRRFQQALLFVFILSGLVACGGGGGGSGGSSPPPPPANRAPVANAGADQNVTVNATVTLNGTASSDADGNTLTYTWTLTGRPTGSTAALSSATAASPTFTADLAGTYQAQLVVNDGTVNSAADTVTITASAGNSAPVANAGPDQNVMTGVLVTLNGTASSDADGDTLTFQWTLTSVPAGSAATLSSTSAASPTFTADVDGSYTAQLIVNDSVDSSVADTVTIVASSANSTPVANAGPDQNVQTGSVVTLDGTASTDGDGDSLTYLWSLTSVPTGSTATLSSTTAASPTFTADLDGSYIAQLVVNDGTVSSAPDTVTITASIANSAPVADAGPDQTVDTSTFVYLDGSASSDADGNGLTYAWTMVSKPVGSTAVLIDPMLATAAFTADLVGSYVFSLVVNDGLVDSAPDTVQVEAIEPTVRLFWKQGSNFNEVAFPFTLDATTDDNATMAPDDVVLGEYKLLAQGQSFTVTNLSATDANSWVVPYFSGLTNNQILNDGDEVEFQLMSPLTHGDTAVITYSFEILGTGETFVVNIDFTSQF